MTQRKQKRAKAKNQPDRVSVRERVFETDSTYFLKLVVFTLLGTLWLKFQQPVVWLGLPLGGLPLGFLAGLLLVRYFEKYQADRKIWYAILLVVTIVCYFVPAGIVL
jgi:NhaP-type Na+/H+ or K+/H+ antiporter